VLLIPITLFLLGLPNKGPSAAAHEKVNVRADPQMTPEYATLASMGALPLQQAVLAGAMTPKVTERDFLELQGAAREEYRRKELDGQMISVRGQFARVPGSDRLFSVVRFRVQCCAADAIQYEIPALCRESLDGITNKEWVQVTGRVQFQKRRDGNFMTVLIVPRRSNVVLTEPDPNPYLQ
jgi:uncharacterized membrane protein YcgQ (UPF0703/DUF1980 family)